VRLPTLGALALVALVAIVFWRSQLFSVSRPGEHPRALALRPPAARTRVDLDVVLPVVPGGLREVRGGEGVLLIHYWAMWERDGRSQAVALDSLRRLEAPAGLAVLAVCFDPMPSVARFVGRNRLRLPVLIDVAQDLSRALPCPSIPYTYVLDASGRIAVSQAGEVDWLSPATRAALDTLLREGTGLERVLRGRSGGAADSTARPRDADHRPSE